MIIMSDVIAPFVHIAKLPKYIVLDRTCHNTLRSLHVTYGTRCSWFVLYRVDDDKPGQKDFLPS